MSFMHVPLNKVHTRSSTSDGKFKKKSVSHLEVDFDTAYIINRTALADSQDSASQKAANIGIESIWEDERRRRLAEFSQNMPELKQPEEEHRKCDITKSESFFLGALKDQYARLSQNEHSFDDFNKTITENQTLKKTFNLAKFIESSTYGVEFSQSSKSSKEEFDANLTLSSKESQSVEELEKEFLFGQSKDEREMSDFIDEIENEENEPENDSILAPFSQCSEDSIETSQNEDRENLSESVTKKFIEELENDEDDEESVFNMTLADLEAALIGHNTEDLTFPQLDGVDDKNLPSSSKIKNEPLSQSSNDLIITHDLQISLQNLANCIGSSEQILNLKEETNEKIEVEKENTFDDQNSSNTSCIVITPSSEPPDPLIVLDTLVEYDIPEIVNKAAFYSNPSDVTEKQQVGNRILEIRSDCLNDCDDYKSLLFNTNRMKFYQSQKVSHSFGFKSKNKKTTFESINSQSSMKIHPIGEPPTYDDAKQWLQSFSDQGKDHKQEINNPDQESPIKVKREKTIMMLSVEKGANAEELSEDLDRTLVPQTPDYNNITVIEDSIEKDSPSLSNYYEDGIYLNFTERKKRRRKMKQSFGKRFQEIMKAKAVSATATTSKEETMSESTITNNEKMSESSEDFLASPSGMNTFSESIPSIIYDANMPLSDSLDASTFNNSFGFKMKLESLHSNDEHTDLTVLSMELHVQTKGDFKPNPETDQISAIFYSLEGFYVNEQPICLNGIIIVHDNDNLGFFRDKIDIIKCKNEMELLDEFFKKIRQYDPDIFAGYEIELQSWGYLIERGYVLNMNLCNALSRMPLDYEFKSKLSHDDDDHDRGEYNTEQRIPGRILLDVWRLMRHEIALTSYTFENMAYHLLHRRFVFYIFLNKMMIY